ncbi:MAG: hypothetical protein AABZ15_11760 [Nitrospirota bacterium]
MGKSVDDEIKEKAFQLWRKCGRSPERVVKELRDQGHMVTRQSIDTWKNKGLWEDRAARAEALEQTVNDPQLSGEEKMIAALLGQKDRYEKYFETLPIGEMDTQAVYAYTNMITTIQSIRQKTAAYKAEQFIDFMKDLIGWLSKNDPESVPAIEKNFDDFIAFAKEKYGKR